MFSMLLRSVARFKGAGLSSECWGHAVSEYNMDLADTLPLPHKWQMCAGCMREDVWWDPGLGSLARVLANESSHAKRWETCVKYGCEHCYVVPCAS